MIDDPPEPTEPEPIPPDPTPEPEGAVVVISIASEGNVRVIVSQDVASGNRRIQTPRIHDKHKR